MDVLIMTKEIAPIIIVALSVVLIIIKNLQKAKRENNLRLEELHLIKSRIIDAYIKEDKSVSDDLLNSYKHLGGNGFVTQLHKSAKLCDIQIHSKNCINCGAPVKKGQIKCEYCGTEY
jgi:hypothetical protein